MSVTSVEKVKIAADLYRCFTNPYSVAYDTIVAVLHISTSPTTIPTIFFNY